MATAIKTDRLNAAKTPPALQPQHVIALSPVFSGTPDATGLDPIPNAGINRGKESHDGNVVTGKSGTSLLAEGPAQSDIPFSTHNNCNVKMNFRRELTRCC